MPLAMLIKSALRDWLSVSYDMKNNSADWLAALASPYPATPDFPRLRGKGGGASHQRGIAFPRPSGRLYGFRRQRRYKNWRRRRRTSPAQRYYITPEGGALNPPVRRSRSPAEPLAPRAKGPAAPSTLTPVRACQPSGIPESTAQVPIPIPTALPPPPNAAKGRAPMSPAFFSTPKEHAGLLITIPFPQ